MSMIPLIHIMLKNKTENKEANMPLIEVIKRLDELSKKNKFIVLSGKEIETHEEIEGILAACASYGMTIYMQSSDCSYTQNRALLEAYSVNVVSPADIAMLLLNKN